jgi:hypothetical protein
VFEAAFRVGRLKDLFRQPVNDEPALSLALHEIDLMQNPQVMRNIHHFELQGLPELAHGPRPRPERLHEAQSSRIAQRFEPFGTPLGLERVAHKGSQTLKDEHVEVRAPIVPAAPRERQRSHDFKPAR